MNSTSNSPESELESSRDYFPALELHHPRRERTLSETTNQFFVAEAMPQGVPSDSGKRFAYPDSWLSKGIPELASPLAG